MKNDESAFDSIQISCKDSTCKNSNCTFGELKNSYDMVKYLPINAKKGLLFFMKDGEEGIEYTSCECDSKFAAQLRPLWKNKDFYFYTDDPDDVCIGEDY